MNLAAPFIRRPVMTTLVMVTILFFGFLAYEKLPVSDLPNVDYPTIQVTVAYPGANPETMANNVAVPLEREFMTIQGLETIVSQSLTGHMFIVLQFDLEKNLDAAAVDVQSAISRAQPNLPANLPYNPTYQKLNPSQTPIIYYALTSPSMDLAKLYDYANTFIAKRLTMVNGVAQVIAYGSPYAARVQVDPQKLAAKEIGIDEVVNAVQQGNVNLPLGSLFGPKGEFTIDVDGQLKDAAGYNSLVLKADNGSLVRVQDIGRALNSQQDDKYTLKFYQKENIERSVFLGIQTQPGANSVRVTEAIDALLPELKKELPPSISYTTVFKKAEIIKESVNDVKLTLFIAFILVVAIIYLSLGKAMNTIIPALAIPLSIFGTFTIMFLLDFSIDILSLLAITLSIGFLIDDAIVVLENNVRHVQLGEPPLEASLKGSKEISTTVLSMTLCLASVFIPMLFLGGVIGRLFREFAVTIFVAVLFSGFISLSLTPLLSSKFIPPYGKDSRKGKVEKWSEAIYERMIEYYRRGLLWSLSHRKTLLAIGSASIVLTLVLLAVLPKDFIPNEDEGFIQGFTEGRNGISPFHMAELQNNIASIINQSPDVESVVSACSMSGLSSDNQGILFVRLKPYHKRRAINTIIDDLLQESFHIPGINTYLSPLPLINLQVGIGMKALYQYAITSIDEKALFDAVPKMVNKMKTLPGFTQVSSDLQIKQPIVSFTIDRDRASDLKLTAQQIESLFTYAYSDGKISTINTPINQYQVIVETLPSFYKDPTVISSLYIRNGQNALVPLKEIVHVKETVGPLTVNHVNGLSAATISFNVDGIALGTAIQELDKASKTILPPQVRGTVHGAADVFKRSFSNLKFLFLITLFTIYIILGILYESFIHPLTVMSALPPAIVGGLLMLFLFGEPLSLFSFVGLIMLLGIVMKNGIMMVDFANAQIEEEKKSPFDAIYNASLIRFRPIMMTTFAALMGAVPIALGIGGASAQSRIPLGLVVIGGLIVSQALTLFLTPVIYYYFQTFQEKLRQKSKG